MNKHQVNWAYVCNGLCSTTLVFAAIAAYSGYNPTPNYGTLPPFSVLISAIFMIFSIVMWLASLIALLLLLIVKPRQFTIFFVRNDHVLHPLIFALGLAAYFAIGLLAVGGFYPSAHFYLYPDLMLNISGLLAGACIALTIFSIWVIPTQKTRKSSK
jgi:hypothetical protein